MAENRVRLEIIMSQALEDDFLNALVQAVPTHKYTKVSGVTGRGYSVPKLGDAVWPQENTMFIMYCDPEEAARTLGVVAAIRKEYAGEGLACFKSEAEEL